MSTNPIPMDYRVDHLFLLVGTNPLPNYVAARLLLREGGKIHLVHSGDPDKLSGTVRIADQLSKVLKQHGILTGSTIGVAESNAADIYKKVLEVSRRLPNAVGLNYTGGTKSMAVHSYRALQSQSRPTPTVFSYLDSNNMVMRIEPIRGERDPSVSVVGAVEPRIRELVELHGEPIHDELPSKEVVLSHLATSLAKACGSAGIGAEWRKWCNEVLRKKAWGGRYLKPEEELKSLCLAWPRHAGLAGFVAALRSASGLSESPEFCLEPASACLGLRSCQELCSWLDGDWLEYYVVMAAANLHKDELVHDFGRTLDTIREQAEHDFEMDVAMMKGYQLYAISCTTSTLKSPCQAKLFEAVIRGKQLGGDESCIGLVSLYDKPDDLRQKVIRFWQPKAKVKVFGPEHLDKLEQCLRTWVSKGG